MSTPALSKPSAKGFSLLELMVAMVVTLVITGAMYGLIASGQGAFRREPALIDRQQQVRIAMMRIEEDVRNAGLGLGNLVQSFGPDLNAVGMVGVRPTGDANLGGGDSDFIEIRQKTADCPQVRLDPDEPIQGGNSVNFNAVDAFPECYPEPGWVLAFYPDGNAKWGWGHNQHGAANQKFNFPGGQQPEGSQMTQFPSNENLRCSVDMEITGGVCPPGNSNPPIFFAQMDRIRYQLGEDTDGVPTLFRSASGGFDGATEAFSDPPGNAWQVVARGIEDMQFRYRTFAGWQDNAPTIEPLAASPYDNVVREVEITLWARTIGENQLQGQSVAAGNGVTAVRGSLVTSVAPRQAQISLMSETDAAKRWQ